MRTNILILLTLVIGTLGLYARVARFDFINFDDNFYVTENARIRSGLSWDNVAWAMTATVRDNWHPLTLVSYMLDVSMFGVRPGWMHAENVIIHACNACLLFLLLLSMTNARWPAAWVAAMFAWHPLHVESVAWISERKDVLSTFFLMLCLLAYVRYVRRRSGRWYLLTLLLLTLALASKLMVMTAPILMLILDIWPLQRIERSNATMSIPARLRTLIVEKIPMLALVAVCAVIGFRLIEGRVLHPLPLIDRIPAAVICCARYLWLTIAPRNLAIFYPASTFMRGDHVDWTLAIVSAVALVLITFVALQQMRRQPWLVAGWLWYLVSLAPVSGLMQHARHLQADRYTYVPLIGIFLAIAWSVDHMLKHHAHLRPMLISGAAASLVAAAMVSWHQIGFWRDSETVMRHAIEAVPGNFVAHGNLGQVYDLRGDDARAVAEYQEALRENPEDPLALNNLGLRAMRQGKLSEAIDWFQRAIGANPSNIPAYLHCAQLLQASGRTADAIALCRTAIQNAPNDVRPCVRLGSLLAADGRIDEAIPVWQAALKIDPDDVDAHEALGTALLMRGQTGEGIVELRAALRIDPDRVDALNALAWTLATDPNPLYQNGAEAERLARHAVDLMHANDPITLDTLAAAEAREGKFDEAVEDATRALNLTEQQKRDELAVKIRARIALYRSSKAFSSGG